IRGIRSEGDIKIARIRFDRKLKGRWHDADNSMRLAVQHQHPSNDILDAGEMVLPKLIANDNFESTGTTSGLFVAPNETPAHKGFNPEHIKKLSTHLLSVHIL